MADTAENTLRESERLLELAEAEARFYREDFEELSYKEQRELIVGNAARIHSIAKAARENAEFLERGHLGKTTRKAWTYIRAAELKDIEGLEDWTIGHLLGIKQSKSEEANARVDISNVRRSITKGKKLLNVVHRGCWEEYAAQQRQRLGTE